MDKTGIIVVSLCVALLGWWFYEQNKIGQEQARYAAAHPKIVAVATNSGAVQTTTTTSTTVSTPTIIFATDAHEETLVLTNGRARYTFTSRGGGLSQDRKSVV